MACVFPTHKKGEGHRSRMVLGNEGVNCGFILIDVKSREEAVVWAMQMPDSQGDGEGQIELR